MNGTNPSEDLLWNILFSAEVVAVTDLIAGESITAVDQAIAVSLMPWAAQTQARVVVLRNVPSQTFIVGVPQTRVVVVRNTSSQTSIFGIPEPEADYKG